MLCDDESCYVRMTDVEMESVMMIYLLCYMLMPCVFPRGTEDQSYVPTGAHVARVRERARDWVEDEARAKASWRATRSDRGGP
ncbi:hypothetical protein E6C27_scaffold121G00590 [Cucumis melo var. makuwa]|uniref:Uncharacterized protein n=1 Tax=Cucumis melo var. makuwa TaxID=1194695 RepID=A0A5A7TC48_CUCMM|nr:hypothetical protein E6C27_scaffold121G00590 [Cucumis melo var. makuwa]